MDEVNEMSTKAIEEPDFDLDAIKEELIDMPNNHTMKEVAKTTAIAAGAIGVWELGKAGVKWVKAKIKNRRDKKKKEAGEPVTVEASYEVHNDEDKK